MKVNPVLINKNINFKGHEARKLDALVVQNRKHNANIIFEQLNNIAMQHKLRVIQAPKDAPTWIQDYIVITPEKKALGYLAHSDELTKQCGFEKIDSNNPLNFKSDTSEGGNIFYVKNKDNQNILIYSKDEKTDCLLGLEKEYNVAKIIELPKADYHTDLFITPIGDNKILVANDNLMLEEITKMSQKISDFITANPTDKDIDRLKQIQEKIINLGIEFSSSKEVFKNKNADEQVCEILEKEGFEIIKVPSRLYECNKDTPILLSRRKLNYSNAITFKNDKNEVVYITGKSHIDDEIGITKEISKKVGIGFENAFKDSISEHIKLENIYFINGSDDIPLSDVLYKFGGGLHCMCFEVPSI